MTTKLPTLEYSAPPAFFAGAFDHSQRQSWIAVVTILVMGVMSAFAAFAGRSFLHGFYRGFGFFAFQLPTTPPLSEEQFTALMADLEAYLASRYANVEVRTEPEEGDALRGKRGIEKLERRQ